MIYDRYCVHSFIHSFRGLIYCSPRIPTQRLMWSTHCLNAEARAWCPSDTCWKEITVRPSCCGQWLQNSCHALFCAAKYLETREGQVRCGAMNGAPAVERRLRPKWRIFLLLVVCADAAGNELRRVATKTGHTISSDELIVLSGYLRKSLLLSNFITLSPDHHHDALYKCPDCSSKRPIR